MVSLSFGLCPRESWHFMTLCKWIFLRWRVWWCTETCAVLALGIRVIIRVCAPQEWRAATAPFRDFSPGFPISSRPHTHCCRCYFKPLGFSQHLQFSLKEVPLSPCYSVKWFPQLCVWQAERTGLGRRGAGRHERECMRHT